MSEDKCKGCSYEKQCRDALSCEHIEDLIEQTKKEIRRTDNK